MAKIQPTQNLENSVQITDRHMMSLQGFFQLARRADAPQPVLLGDKGTTRYWDREEIDAFLCKVRPFDTLSALRSLRQMAALSVKQKGVRNDRSRT
ncbi:hypothetical protein [Methylovulum psychrotolerans]|uniref:hypothetical protein n=1 Tax=Methylovulum psychrotolerans TaxID=1704499 RepID=UPI0012F980E1|nr:hypothetical protein [Methylovulum psychrotolerans]